MNLSTQTLLRNENGRWQFGDCELTSGDLVEIQIEGQWICGVIEYWQDSYYWFSRKEGVMVTLHNGVKARHPTSAQRRL